MGSARSPRARLDIAKVRRGRDFEKREPAADVWPLLTSAGKERALSSGGQLGAALPGAAPAA
ncbi:MAG: hypothetical protein ABI200_04295, partial [Gaiellales bacterium]